MSATPLFLYAYADPQDLPSFPTRRSSDLSHELALAIELNDAGISPSMLGISIRSETILDRYRIRGYTVENLVTTLKTEGLDRKSTRLNSSHLVISYAVFCLKKKTNQIHT